jgi:hypothetical protein
MKKTSSKKEKENPCLLFCKGVESPFDKPDNNFTWDETPVKTFNSYEECIAWLAKNLQNVNEYIDLEDDDHLEAIEDGEMGFEIFSGSRYEHPFFIDITHSHDKIWSDIQKMKKKMCQVK